MIAKKRKTLAVCEDCHHKIHHPGTPIRSNNGEPHTSRGVSAVLGGDYANLP